MAPSGRDRVSGEFIAGLRQAEGTATIASMSAPSEGRPPAVLQVIPRLVSGGAERGTVEMAGALAAAGWNAYVASAGGPLEPIIARSGGTHLTLPLASKNPLVMRRNVSGAGPRDPAISTSTSSMPAAAPRRGARGRRRAPPGAIS